MELCIVVIQRGGIVEPGSVESGIILFYYVALFIALILTVVGLILAIKGYKRVECADKKHQKFSIAGMVFSGAFLNMLLLSFLNMAVTMIIH